MPQPTLTASPSRSLWRHPGVPSFCAAASLARLAEEMFSVAVVLLVLARTGSAALAGATVAAATLPSVVTGPLLGAWLDRTARRRLALALNKPCSPPAWPASCRPPGGRPASSCPPWPWSPAAPRPC